jgi:hypothetical protein
MVCTQPPVSQDLGCLAVDSRPNVAAEIAQNELGEVVFVDLPDVGKELKKGQTALSVDSVKAVAEVYAPGGSRAGTLHVHVSGCLCVYNT